MTNNFAIFVQVFSRLFRHFRRIFCRSGRRNICQNSLKLSRVKKFLELEKSRKTWTKIADLKFIRTPTFKIDVQ